MKLSPWSNSILPYVVAIMTCWIILGTELTPDPVETPEHIHAPPSPDLDTGERPDYVWLSYRVNSTNGLGKQGPIKESEITAWNRKRTYRYFELQIEEICSECGIADYQKQRLVAAAREATENDVVSQRQGWKFDGNQYTGERITYYVNDRDRLGRNVAWNLAVVEILTPQQLSDLDSKTKSREQEMLLAVIRYITAIVSEELQLDSGQRAKLKMLLNDKTWLPRYRIRMNDVSRKWEALEYSKMAELKRSDLEEFLTIDQLRLWRFLVNDGIHFCFKQNGFEMEEFLRVNRHIEMDSSGSFFQPELQR